MNPTDSYEPHPEQAAGEVIDGEAVVINLATGVYYSLDGAAGVIWRMVTARMDVPSMVAELAASYDVEAVDAERDLRRVLGQLVAEGVIRPAETPGGGMVPHPPAAAVRAPYVTPNVQVYRDMQDLLALDPPSPGINGLVWKRSTDPA